MCSQLQSSIPHVCRHPCLLQHGAALPLQTGCASSALGVPPAPRRLICASFVFAAGSMAADPLLQLQATEKSLSVF